MSFSTADWDHLGVIELTEEGQKFRVEVKPDVLNPKKNPWSAEVVSALSE